MHACSTVFPRPSKAEIMYKDKVKSNVTFRPVFNALLNGALDFP
jgi:hypothetical protein